MSVAKKYTGGHLSFLDLIQEGNLGLIHIKSVVVIYPYYSDDEKGLRINLYIDRIVEYCNVEKEELLNNLPPGDTNKRYYKSEDIDRLVAVLKKE